MPQSYGDLVPSLFPHPKQGRESQLGMAMFRSNDLSDPNTETQSQDIIAEPSDDLVLLMNGNADKLGSNGKRAWSALLFFENKPSGNLIDWFFGDCVERPTRGFLRVKVGQAPTDQCKSPKKK